MQRKKDALTFLELEYAQFFFVNLLTYAYYKILGTYPKIASNRNTTNGLGIHAVEWYIRHPCYVEYASILHGTYRVDLSTLLSRMEL